MRDSKLRVCIVGAGPAGLAAARQLKARDIPYDQFERHSDVGGIWDIDNPGTPMYESAHFISSRDRSGYYGYPMPADFPDYPRREDVLAYTRDFARDAGLLPAIRFNTAVDGVRPAGGGWEVELRGDPARLYSHVICASGHTWVPNWPDYPGTFSGQVMHAVDYRRADLFRGKRVLIVGAGNSACDIACEAARTADRAYISMRRGYHFIPKHILGRPADVFGEASRWLPMRVRQAMFGVLLRLLQGDPTRYGLAAPDHRVLESHPIVNSQLMYHLQHGDVSVRGDIERLDGDSVVFKDGPRADVDLVVYATGYRYQIPYVDEALFDWERGKPRLSYTVFNPRHPSLFALGFTEMNAGGYFFFDEMASLIASAIEMQGREGEAWERGAAGLLDTFDFRGALGLVDSQRHAGYLDARTFLKACRRLNRRMGWRPPVQSV